MNIKWIILGIIIGILLFFGFGFYSGFNYKVCPQGKTETKHDTVWKDTTIYIQADKIDLKKVKAKIIYLEKKIIVYKDSSFCASIDTIVKGDTISVGYYFPENVMDLTVHRKADSIIIKKEFITEIRTITLPPLEVAKPKDFWDYLREGGEIVGSVFIGYELGKTFK